MKLSLKDLRVAKGYTQDELSKLSGVNRANIGSYEIGDSGMTLETAYKLAKALGCTIDELLREE